MGRGRLEELRHATVVLVTSSDDLAADLLTLNLRQAEVNFVRLNVDKYPEAYEAWARPDQGYLCLRGPDFEVKVDKITRCWFRRYPRTCSGASEHRLERLIHQEARSFMLGALIGASGFWINHPHAVSVAENKLLQAQLAGSIGLRMPATIFGNHPDKIREFAIEKGDVVAKAVEGRSITVTGQRYGLFTQIITPSDFKDSGAIRACPVTVQEYIAKSLDVRVTVVGARVFAVGIVSPEGSATDWKLADPSMLRLRELELSADMQERCIRLVRELGLHYAALDFVVSHDGTFYFLEANPSGQWGWFDIASTEGITEAIVADLSGMVA